MGFLDRFSRTKNEPGPGGPPDEVAAERIRGMLGEAGATTLRGCSQILAIAIVHERPHLTGHPAEEIARTFVEQYKAPGWVPADLTLEAHTPVEMVHRPDAASLQSTESNGVLAETVSKLAPTANLDECSAIGFSGDNPALGHTFFSILAK